MHDLPYGNINNYNLNLFIYLLIERKLKVCKTLFLRIKVEIIKAIIIDNTDHEFNAFNHFNDYANVWSREPDKNWKLERLIKMISFLMHTYFEHYYTEHVSKDNIITFFQQSMSLKLTALQQLTGWSTPFFFFDITLSKNSGIQEKTRKFSQSFILLFS